MAHGLNNVFLFKYVFKSILSGFVEYQNRKKEALSSLLRIRPCYCVGSCYKVSRKKISRINNNQLLLLQTTSCLVAVFLGMYELFHTYFASFLGIVSFNCNKQVTDRLLKSNLNKSRMDITFSEGKQILKLLSLIFRCTS